MSQTAVSMRAVGKRYTKYDDQPTLLNTLKFGGRSKRSHLWAVQDFDLEIAAGECVGVLGRNGAGKSTVLQMLAGVTAPTVGTVAVSGRVAPLISVGVGFHPELTGRENVYVNGAVLGIDRRTVDRRLDHIVGFAEIENFIDTPVKFYSSGMFVRLGFAVAVEADPDLLLVDEILAVGDFAFQLKCFARMNEIRERGTTIVVVSHNINSIRGFCQRVAVLDHGRKVFDGPTFDGVDHYYRMLGELPPDEDLDGRGVDIEPDALAIDSFEVIDADDKPTGHVNSGERCIFRISAHAMTDIEQPFLGLTVASESGVVVYSDTNRLAPLDTVRAGEKVVFEIAVDARLTTGGYVATSSVHRSVGDNSALLARAVPVQFFVSGRSLVTGVADLGGSFTMRS